MQRPGSRCRFRIGAAYDALSCSCPSRVDAGRSGSPPERYRGQKQSSIGFQPVLAAPAFAATRGLGRCLQRPGSRCPVPGSAAYDGLAAVSTNLPAIGLATAEAFATRTHPQKAWRRWQRISSRGPLNVLDIALEGLLLSSDRGRKPLERLSWPHRGADDLTELVAWRAILGGDSTLPVP